MDESRLVRLAVEAPDLLDRIVELLDGGDITLDGSRTHLAYRLVAPEGLIDEIHGVMQEWPVRGAEGTRAFVGLLRAVRGVRRATLERTPTCEVVWTGTGGTGSVRSTVPVILEMLAGAKRSVLLLSYSVWLKQAKVNGVLQRLADLSASGVDVAWIFDARYENGHNIRELARHWPPGHRRPTAYSWENLDDEIAKLHAKVLIVDDHDALVTSANLTGHGLTSNVEVGLRVQGRPAADLAAHLRRLIAAGTFAPCEWP